MGKNNRPKPKSGDDKSPVQITEAMKAYDEHRRSLPPSKKPLQRSANLYGKKDSPEMRTAFLDWLRTGVTPTRAADECGIGRTTVENWRLKDDEFRAQWAAAVAEGIERIEDEARRRGVDGVDRPVFQQGECVGFVREYSDDLLKFVLAARDPQRYSKGALNGNAGGPDISFTFVFGTGGSTQASGPPIRAAVDGNVSGRSDLQPGGQSGQPRALLDHRSNDESGEDGGVSCLAD